MWRSLPLLPVTKSVRWIISAIRTCSGIHATGCVLRISTNSPGPWTGCAARYSFDLVIATSGAEDLTFPAPLCGTPRERVGRFLDKMEMQRFFEDLEVPVPLIAADGEYPVMAKPRRGAGGWRNAVLHDAGEEKRWASLYPDVPYIRQQVADGIPASVCCVANGDKARAIAVNEQLLRENGASAFGFSGSVTPFDHPMAGQMVTLAEKVAASSGCTGTLGIDFIIGRDTPRVIEVNPRFQGTLDTVEAAYACNLFRFHVNACAGTLPGSAAGADLCRTAHSLCRPRLDP